MMTTPICDFVRSYASKGDLRLHMPGHKGRGELGVEALDISEIQGADSLYEAEGIIRESEKNAGSLFGAHSFYSTEGSSLCIRAMLFLAVQHARSAGKKAIVAAGRNAHKSFLSALALLDVQPLWIYPEEGGSYLSCRIEPETLENMFEAADEKPSVVYITSPDYLGCMSDIAALSRVCKKYGALLLVDNAHGAYTKFLPRSLHPIDLGADMCCDSAHKTLPVLTGGAYLHISKGAPETLSDSAKTALSLFGSTSPSYLILQSLDGANAYLSDGYREKLRKFAELAEKSRLRLAAAGYTLLGDEPLKISIRPKSRGYTGVQLSDALLKTGIVCEFADPDFTVMMLSPEMGEQALERLESALLALPEKRAITELPPGLHREETVMSVRDAVFAASEEIDAEESVGRVLAAANVACPPAVPILVCGERISPAAVERFRYYGIERCRVVK